MADDVTVITIGESRNKELIQDALERLVDFVDTSETLYTTSHSLSFVVSLAASRLRLCGQYAKADWLERLREQSGACRVPRGYPEHVRKLGSI